MATNFKIYIFFFNFNKLISSTETEVKSILAPAFGPVGAVLCIASANGAKIILVFKNIKYGAIQLLSSMTPMTCRLQDSRKTNQKNVAKKLKHQLNTDQKPISQILKYAEQPSCTREH